MDIIRQLGAIALGSRFKRISNMLMKDVGEIYKTSGIDFEPKWFPVFYLLKMESPISITEIAQKISFTHPAVNQIVSSMLGKKIIKEFKDKKDNRKRLVELNSKGKEMLNLLEPVWEILEQTTNEILQNSKFDLLGAVDDFEQALIEKKYLSRVNEKIKLRQLNKIEIINYSAKYKKYFKKFNVEWLDKYFRVEDMDKRIFADPQKEVINKGGHILFAKFNGEIVGTAALFKLSKNTFELAKMGVTEKARGLQIGKKLLIEAIATAKKRRAEKIILYSNTKLVPAVSLYKKFDFIPVPISSEESSLYERANIKMELLLNF